MFENVLKILILFEDHVKNMYCNGAKHFYTTLLFWVTDTDISCLLKIPSLFKFSYIVLHKFTDRETGGLSQSQNILL